MQQRESGKEYLVGCELVWALDLIKYFGPSLGGKLQFRRPIDF